MDSDIQFGDMQFEQPDQAIRPDQDDHYAILVCGSPPVDDLPIFVDLDVMRDMEAHSQSDKTVELGGVLLGQRYLDQNSQPFVVVSDWLQADHYESTQSRFKFTHETWSDITRRRQGYPKDTEMVGWYHTHPGWGIFLSDMDMFICKNFFNQPLDVALVIDPCKQTRGWFQWTDETATQTREVSGFYLMTSRHRESELEYFADLYNGTLTMNDPRYSEPVRSGGGASPIINVSDRRNPTLDMAIVGMLAMQFILLSLVAWRMVVPAVPAKDDTVAADVAQAQFEYQQLGYRKALQDLADPSGQSSDRMTKLFQQFEDTQNENRRLIAGQDAQVVFSEKLKQNVNELNMALANSRTENESLKTRYDQTREDLNDNVQRVKALEEEVKTGVKPDAGWSFDYRRNWWWALLASVVVGVASMFGTLYYVRRDADDEFEDQVENDDGGKADSESEASPRSSSDSADENINFS